MPTSPLSLFIPWPMSPTESDPPFVIFMAISFAAKTILPAAKKVSLGDLIGIVPVCCCRPSSLIDSEDGLHSQYGR